MTIEEQLKQFIVIKYGTVRNFCEQTNIPQSTLSTIFKRGIQRTSIDLIFKICDELAISADAIAEGKIIPKDTFESKDRYQGRIVEFDCMAVFDRKLPKKSFIAGRLAMTCCVDDIQLIGHLVAYKDDINLRNKSWIHLKAAVHYMKFKGNPEEQVVFDALEITPIETPDDERALLTLR